MESILYIRRGHQSPSAAGDRVFDRNLIAGLRRFAEVEELELPPCSKPAALVNVLTLRKPPIFAAYGHRGNVEQAREAIARLRPDHVVLSHETFGPLCLALDHPSLLNIAQNIYGPKAPVAGLDNLFWRWEHRHQRTLLERFRRIVVVSDYDRAVLREAFNPALEVTCTPPGAPPASPLAPDAGCEACLVLTGTYNWRRKRTDLDAFAAEAAALRDLPIILGPEVLRDRLGALECRPMDGVDWSAAIRFGILTDRFQTGFKLKALEYIARNCVVIAFSDVSGEFAGLPYANDFVHVVADATGVRSVVAALAAQPKADLHARFQAFRDACLARFTWDRAAAELYVVLSARNIPPP